LGCRGNHLVSIVQQEKIGHCDEASTWLASEVSDSGFKIRNGVNRRRDQSHLRGTCGLPQSRIEAS